jgi:N-acylneuraminate cytidylyltransferase
MVSTDDSEIAKIARAEGAKVPFMRSSENSDDHASTLSVIKEVILEYKARGHEFDEYCCIYPTAPLLDPDTLREAHQKMVQSGAHSIIPVCRFSYPIQRALRLQGGRIQMASPEYSSFRSQDLEPRFHDVGQFYMGRTEDLFKISSLFDQEPAAIEIDELKVQDIDHESDWKMAELKYRLLQESKKN